MELPGWFPMEGMDLNFRICKNLQPLKGSIKVPFRGFRGNNQFKNIQINGTYHHKFNKASSPPY